MDPNEIDDWFTDLEDRLALTQDEHIALQVLRENDLIFEAIATSFVHMDELEEWIKHDREAAKRRFAEILEMNLKWQEMYNRDWAPRLSLLNQLESAGMPLANLETFLKRVIELASARPFGPRFVTPNGKYFHRRECKWLADVPDALLSSVQHDDAVDRGYKPCRTCRA